MLLRELKKYLIGSFEHLAKVVWETNPSPHLPLIVFAVTSVTEYGDSESGLYSYIVQCSVFAESQVSRDSITIDVVNDLMKVNYKPLENGSINRVLFKGLTNLGYVEGAFQNSIFFEFIIQNNEGENK